MPTPGEQRVLAALRATVLVVLEGAVPTYACWGWGGLGDGRGRIEGRERTRGDVIGVVLEGDPWSPRSEDVREEYGMAVRGRVGHAPLSGDIHKR